MPIVRPSRSDVHINRPLGNVSVAYMQDATVFVADRVFPNIPVAKQSDSYFEYPRGDWNLDEMAERAPATESAGGTYGVTTSSYSAKVRAFHRDVPDQVRDNSDDPISLDAEATRFVTHKALINRERNWATTFFTGGVWTFEADGVASSPTSPGSFDPTNASNNDKLQWNDPASTPIEDVRQGKRFVLESTGFMPNKLTLGRAVFDTLLDHPDIVGRVDRGQTSGPAIATRQALAALFEVEEVLVMDAIYNQAKKGQTAVHRFIAGKHALLSYAPATAGLMTPSAGYTFSWTGYTGASGVGTRIFTFRMQHLRADRVEIEAAYDMKKVAADLGYFFDGIVA